MDYDSNNFEWQWKENLNLSDKDPKAWKPYHSDIMEMINKSYQLGKESVDFKIGKITYFIRFKEMKQYMKIDEFKRRDVRKLAFNKTEESNYHWYWQENINPFDELQSPTWAPYVISIDKFIEFNYKNNILNFEIVINNEIYSIDLINKWQFQKNNNHFRRPIERASKRDNLVVVRKNLLVHLIEDKDHHNRFFGLQKEGKNNLQIKIKVNSFFENNKANQFIFDEKNKLFNTEICLSKKLHDTMKNHFYGKIKFNSNYEVLKYLEDEILKEAEKKQFNIEIDKSLMNILDYSEQARYYVEILNAVDGLEIGAKLFKIYTIEGFLENSLKSSLQTGFPFDSNLFLYFILLQSAFVELSHIYYKTQSKKLVALDYLVFQTKAQISIKILEDEFNMLKKNEARFLYFNEFIPAKQYSWIDSKSINKNQTNSDLIEILFILHFQKEDLEENYNLLCIYEKLSDYNEKLTLISSSSIFKIRLIDQLSRQIHLDFISNGLNQYDYIKYSDIEKIDLTGKNIGLPYSNCIAQALHFNNSLKQINLTNKKIGNSGVILIAKALKSNNSLKEIDLHNNDIGVEGISEMAEALKINSSLNSLVLSKNYLTNEGSFLIGKALEQNKGLVKILLQTNRIQVEGGVAIANALKKNKFLKEIYLSENNLQNEGAKAIANALMVNSSLIIIDLSWNKIGSRGGIFFGEALKKNCFLQIIDLSWNSLENSDIIAISEALKINSDLKEINLHYNDYGEEGINSMREILKFKNKINIIY